MDHANDHASNVGSGVNEQKSEISVDGKGKASAPKATHLEDSDAGLDDVAQSLEGGLQVAKAEGRRTHHINKPRSWSIAIKRELLIFNEPKEVLSRETKKSIFRVPPKWKELRKEQYRPDQISMGLYDRSCSEDPNPNAKGDMLRLAIVSAYLTILGRTTDDWEGICERIVEDPRGMQEEYQHDALFDLSTEDVRSALSLDAIFLACYLSAQCEARKAFHEENSQGYKMLQPIINVMRRESPSFHALILNDIIKLENQIPLSLIWDALYLMYEAFDQKSKHLDEPSTFGARGNLEEPLLRNDSEVMTSFMIREDVVQDDKNKLSKKVDEAFQQMCSGAVAICQGALPGFDSSENAITYELVFKDKCKHLLHCVYLAASSTSNPKEARAPAHPLWASLQRAMKNCFSNGRKSRSKTPTARLDFENTPLASASQLSKAGIVFRGQKGSFGDVEFKKHLSKATLFLPKIDILGGECEPLWRNLVAFEDEYELGHEFKSYLNFMDDLIDTDEDVALLTDGRLSVIGTNGLGKDAEVGKLFNTMLTNYVVTPSKKWATVRRDIMEYYGNQDRQLWVEFVTTNFGKPWITASVVAGVVILLLTFIQTIYVILTYNVTV